MRHTKVSALDMARLASSPAAFHQAAVHSFDNRGCTCADQWICAECGTWHRRGKPQWNPSLEQEEEDAICELCGAERPSPLPAVPCALLAQVC